MGQAPAIKFQVKYLLTFCAVEEVKDTCLLRHE